MLEYAKTPFAGEFYITASRKSTARQLKPEPGQGFSSRCPYARAYTIGVIRRSFCNIGLTALAFLAGTQAGANADVVKLRDKPPFRKVQISEIRDGRIVFRGISGQTLSKPLEQVEWIEVDALPALGAAEKARLAGRGDEALSHYRRVLGSTSFPWLRGYVRIRLVGAADAAGRFDEAVAGWLALISDGVSPPPPPRQPAPPGSPANQRAIKLLEEAVRAPGKPEIRQLVTTLLLEVSLVEGLEPLPAGLEPRLAAQAIWAKIPWASEQTQRGGSAAGRSSLLLPDDEPAADSIYLPPDSPVLTAGMSLLAANRADEAARILARALPFVPSRESRPWRIALGRALIESRQHDRAAEVLGGQSGAEPGSEPNGESMYYLGLARQRAGDPAAAREAYRRALASDTLPAELAAAAQEALRQMEAAP